MRTEYARFPSEAVPSRGKCGRGFGFVVSVMVVLASMTFSGCAGYAGGSTSNSSGENNAGASETTSTGTLTASASSINFGNVAVGNTATQSVSVTNTGTAAVTISSANISGGVFTVVGGNPSSSLAAGQSATVQLQFAPTSMNAAAGALTIASNASDSPLSIALSGTGVEAGVSFSPASLNFNNVIVGQTSTQNVTLTNNGNTNLVITAATVSGTGFGMSGLSLPATIAPNQSTTLSMQFAPTSTVGASGSVLFADNAAGGSQVFTMTGSAVAAGSTLGANPGSFNFNSVVVGSSSTETITLTNLGNATLTINSVTAAGAGFSATGISAGQTIAAGSTASFTVGFAPTASGNVSGSITIDSTATNSPLVISLAGNGTQAALTANPSSINFGSILDGATATVNVTLTNSGTASLHINAATTSGAGFSMSTLAAQTLTPGQTASFSVSFAPTTAGTLSGSVSITSTAPGSPLVLGLSGIGTAPEAQLGINPASVAFNSVNVGSSSTQNVTLTNTGNTTLNITSATVTGAGYTMSLQPISISAGGNATFTVTFAPTTAGGASGSISIVSNATNSPVTIALSGTGLQAQIAANPSSVSFGTVVVGSNNSQAVTLTNNGNTTLSISQISVTGTGFGQTGLSTSTKIAAGGSTTFNATFDPSSPTTASGSITLTTNGAPSPLVINLSGTGHAATLVSIAVTPAAPTIAKGSTEQFTATGTYSDGSTQNLTTTATWSSGTQGVATISAAGLATGVATGTSSITASSNGITSPGDALTVGAATLVSIAVTPAAPTIIKGSTQQFTATGMYTDGSTQSLTTTAMWASGTPSVATISAAGLATGVATGSSSITASSQGVTSPVDVLTVGAATLLLGANPTTLSFGNVNAGSSSSLTTTLTNNGNSSVTISGVTVTGAGFSATGIAGGTVLTTGQSATLTVTFAPTIGGPVSGASVSIASNATNSPTTIALSGTGLQAQIAANPSSVSFGTVTVGNTNSQTVTLTNNGNATLSISQINVTGTGFAQTGLSTATKITAGGSATFNATFDPSSATAMTGSITLTTNGAPSSLVINLSGTGQAATLLLGASPTSLSFGNVLDGSSSSLTTTVTNNGNSEVTISGVTVTGAGFTASGISNGTILTPGQSATLTVTFAPTSGGAVSGASVSIASNAANSPATISLSGTGTHSVSLAWTASTTSGVTYNVYRGPSSGGEGTTPINSSPITTTTYQDTNVTAGQEYFYTVKAIDSAGTSAASNEVSANVPTP